MTADRWNRWNAWRFFRFSLLWLALYALWTALLSIVLPQMADGLARDSNGAWGRGSLLAMFAGVGACVSAVTQIVVGWRSDQDLSVWRRWRYLLVGFPLTALPLWGLARASSPFEVVLSLALLQLVANMGTGPYQALIPDEVPPERHGVASTWMGLFQNVGQLVGPILAALLLTQAAGLMKLQAALYGGLMIGLVALWTALPAGRQTAQASVTAPGLMAGLRRALGGDANFRLVLQSRLVINIGFYLVVNFLLFYVQYSLKLPDVSHATTILLTCMVVGGLLGGLVVGPQADRRSKLSLIYLTCGTTAVGMAGFAATPQGGLVPACAFALLAGFGFGGFSVVDWSLACNLAPRASSALSMGIWNLAAVVPQVIAPGVFGPASDALASALSPALAYRLVFASVILFLALGSFRLRNLREPDLKNQATDGPN